MQETYDELDNIVRTLDNLIEEIANKDYIAQLQETKYQAEEELNKVREKLEEEQEEKEQKEERDQLIKYIAERLVDHDESLRIFPKWENKTDNYENLIRFKEGLIDHIGVVRADYKFIKHFNMSVLKLCLNHS